MKPPSISVIIPTRDEERDLPATIDHLRRAGFSEIVVADGGSTDATREAATARSRARFLPCPVPGRAAQMNFAAARCRGEALYFVHADTLVPAGARDGILACLSDPGCAGGGFTRRFDHPSPLLRWAARASDTRSRLLGLFFGDQTLFCRRALFERIGGYADLPAFEDFDLCRRLRRWGRLACLQPPVVSSGRRFGARPLGPMARDAAWTLRYLCGESPGHITGAR